MPDGVVQWFGLAAGQAAIVRGGGPFSVAMADLAPEARQPPRNPQP